MNDIINSIVIGVTTGISTVEATKNYENLKAIIKDENFQLFMSKIIPFSKNALSKLKINNFRFFNTVRVALVFTEIYQILEKKGFNTPQAIAEKILFPAIESISEDENIEVEKDLRDKWVNLLSSEITGNSVHASFVETLKQLDSIDSKILDMVWDNRNKATYPDKYKGFPLKYLTRWLNNKYDSALNNEQIIDSVDILESLGLCYTLTIEEGTLTTEKGTQLNFKRKGIKFMEIVSSSNIPECFY